MKISLNILLIGNSEETKVSKLPSDMTPTKWADDNTDSGVNPSKPIVMLKTVTPRELNRRGITFRRTDQPNLNSIE